MGEKVVDSIKVWAVQEASRFIEFEENITVDEILNRAAMYYDFVTEDEGGDSKVVGFSSIDGGRPN